MREARTEERARERVERGRHLDRFYLGDLEVRRLDGLVIRRSVEYPLQKKAIETLAYLASCYGTVVTRQMLIDEVWSGRATSDDAINRVISNVRSALGDNPGNPKFLETLHGRGYRLLVEPRIERNRKRPKSLFVLSTLVAFIVVLIVAVSLFHTRTKDGMPQGGLVVLGFAEPVGGVDYPEAFEESIRQSLRQSPDLRLLTSRDTRSTYLRLFDSPDTPINRQSTVRIAQDQGADFAVFSELRSKTDLLELHSVVIAADRTLEVANVTITADDYYDLIKNVPSLTSELRRAMGESSDSIAASNLPVQRIASDDPDAMRAFSRAKALRNEGQLYQSIELAKYAAELDPEFALAHVLIGRLYYGTHRNRSLALQHLNLALLHSSRLTPFEIKHVEALKSYFGSPAEMRRAWEVLRNLDDSMLRAHYELGNVEWQYFNDFRRAREAYDAGVVERPTDWVNLYHRGYSELGLGDIDAAVRSFELSRYHAGHFYNYGLVDALIVNSQYRDAKTLIDEARNERRLSPPNTKVIGFYVDLGMTRKARVEIQSALRGMGDIIWPDASLLLTSLAIEWAHQDPQVWATMVERELTRIIDAIEISPPSSDLPPFQQLALSIKFAARAGHTSLAVALYEHATQLPDYLAGNGAYAHMDLGYAEILTARGQFEDAVSTLTNLVNQLDLFQAHESLAHTYEQNGYIEEAGDEYEWLINHRGRAFAETGFAYGREANLVALQRAHLNLASIHETRGNTELADGLREKLRAQLARADDDHLLARLAGVQDEQLIELR